MSEHDFKAFQIKDEPLTFQDRAYIEIATSLVRTSKAGNKREITCDIQAAWDLSKAISDWRENMNKAKE